MNQKVHLKKQKTLWTKRFRCHKMLDVRSSYKWILSMLKCISHTLHCAHVDIIAKRKRDNHHLIKLLVSLVKCVRLADLNASRVSNNYYERTLLEKSALSLDGEKRAAEEYKALFTLGLKKSIDEKLFQSTARNVGWALTLYKTKFNETNFKRKSFNQNLRLRSLFRSYSYSETANERQNYFNRNQQFCENDVDNGESQCLFSRINFIRNGNAKLPTNKGIYEWISFWYADCRI